MIVDEGTLFGRGMAFPPVVGPDGRVRFSTAADNIRENIQLILLTEPQERLMLPEFGGGLKRFVFQANTTATHRLIEETIRQSLGRFEPRIRLDDVSVDADPDDSRAALAIVRYTLIANRTADQLRLRVQLSA